MRSWVKTPKEADPHSLCLFQIMRRFSSSWSRSRELWTLGSFFSKTSSKRQPGTKLKPPSEGLLYLLSAFQQKHVVVWFKRFKLFYLQVLYLYCYGRNKCQILCILLHKHCMRTFSNKDASKFDFDFTLKSLFSELASGACSQL